MSILKTVVNAELCFNCVIEMKYSQVLEFGSQPEHRAIDINVKLCENAKE